MSVVKPLTWIFMCENALSLALSSLPLRLKLGSAAVAAVRARPDIHSLAELRAELDSHHHLLAADVHP